MRKTHSNQTVHNLKIKLTNLFQIEVEQMPAWALLPILLASIIVLGLLVFAK
jgi:hypothetical protein